jgi:F-type H+-transporting ATPase subunit b
MSPSLPKPPILGFGVLLLALVPLPAWGATGGSGGSEALIWQIISFILILILLSRALKKPLRSFLLRRHETIRTALDQASQKEIHAQTLFDHWAGKIEALGREIEELHDRIRKEGQMERDRLIAQAQTESERLQRQAQILADLEVKKARLMLKREVAELAIRAAEEILQNRIEPHDQERLVRKYLAQLRQIQ